MAKLLNNQTDEQLAANTYFVDAEILKNVYYQVYGFDKVYCHDDEGANYRFNNTNKSNIQIQVANDVVTYYKVDVLTVDDITGITEGGTKVDEALTDETIPNNAKVGDLFYTEESDVRTYQVIKADLIAAPAGSIAKAQITDTTTAPAGSVTGEIFVNIVEERTPVSAVNSEPYEYNKYGEIKPNSKIYVTIDVNDTLKSTYTDATITIDGKDYDLGLDGKTITFTMDKDHKIQINWVYGVLVESFRITCKR